MNTVVRRFHYFLRQVNKHLRGRDFFYSNTFRSHTNNFHNCQFVLRLFYLASAGYGAAMSQWSIRQLQESQFYEPLWPFFGLGPDTIRMLVPVCMYAWIVGAVFAFFNTNWRWARVISGLGIFYIGAMINSDGHFAHNYHALVWVSFIFMFFPVVKADSSNRALRHRYIQTFWFAFFGLGVLYVMTGLWKFRGIGECIVDPNMVCELSEKILTNIAAHEHVYYRKFSPLTWILFDYPWVGGLSYLGVLWIHIYSLHFAFRPNLLPLYGVIRVIFHLGTLVLFGVNFSAMTFTVAIVYLMSPFSREGETFLQTLLSVPPFDLIFKRIPYFRTFLARKSWAQ